MKPVELAKDIFWIGAVDYNKRNFHGLQPFPARHDLQQLSRPRREERRVRHGGQRLCRNHVLPPRQADAARQGRLHRREPHRKRPRRGPVPARRALQAREDHHVDHRQAFHGSPVRHHRLAHRSGQDRGRHQHRQAEHPFRGNPYAALARQHGFLHPRRQAPYQQRRLRPEHRLLRTFFGSVRPLRAGKGDQGILLQHRPALLPAGPQDA